MYLASFLNVVNEQQVNWKSHRKEHLIYSVTWVIMEVWEVKSKEYLETSHVQYPNWSAELLIWDMKILNPRFP